jgi:hypothetical protein
MIASRIRSIGMALRASDRNVFPREGHGFEQVQTLALRLAFDDIH